MGPYGGHCANCWRADLDRVVTEHLVGFLVVCGHGSVGFGVKSGVRVLVSLYSQQV